MKHLFDISGRFAVITGGYGYLGRAMVHALCHYGATVCIFGRNKEKYLQAFPEKNSSSAVLKSSFIFCDVLDHESIRSAVANCISTHGRIDILVNNAINVQGQHPDKITPEELSTTLQGTLGSVQQLIVNAHPHIPRGGSIINISSIYGMVSPDFSIYEGNEFLNPPHYGAAKAGVLQLTRYFATWLAPRGIRVNAITPGAFPSSEVQKNSDFITRLQNKIPLRRIGSPVDLSGALLLLASDAGSYITGQNIVVDGGWTIW